MNGIEKITARINADACAEADQIKQQASDEAGKIKAEYDKTAQDEYWKLIKDGVKSCEQRVERLGSTASMEAKKNILALKQEMVSRAFDRAEDMLSDLPAQEYIDLFARLAQEASRTGMEELIFSRRDSGETGKKIVKAANERLKAAGRPGKLTVSEDIRPIKGGFILKDGNIEVNCCAETLTGMYRNELAAQVAGVMFE